LLNLYFLMLPTVDSIRIYIKYAFVFFFYYCLFHFLNRFLPRYTRIFYLKWILLLFWYILIHCDISVLRLLYLKNNSSLTILEFDLSHILKIMLFIFYYVHIASSNLFNIIFGKQKNISKWSSDFFQIYLCQHIKSNDKINLYKIWKLILEKYW
jgi:hypothetical protein